MPKTKEQCPECCTYTISIIPANCDFVYEEQTKMKKLKKRNVSVEAVINKIITEHAFLTGKTDKQ